METRNNRRIGRLFQWLAAVLIVTGLIGGSGVAAKLAAGQRAELKFVASQSDVPVTGEFRKFSADVDFDPTKPTVGSVDIVIDLASVDTGSADADMVLKGKDFFDAAQYPQASFASRSIVANGNGKFRAEGQFTLKGRSHPLVVPFAVRPEGDGLWLEGEVPVSRLAYRIGEGEWSDVGTLADPVMIKFKLFLKR
jgi:polyisoprenoid-binding protein YceI